jgi:hypothetical protein
MEPPPRWLRFRRSHTRSRGPRWFPCTALECRSARWRGARSSIRGAAPPRRTSATPNQRQTEYSRSFNCRYPSAGETGSARDQVCPESAPEPLSRDCPSVALAEPRCGLPLRPACDQEQKSRRARAGPARWLRLRGNGTLARPLLVGLGEQRHARSWTLLLTLRMHRLSGGHPRLQWAGNCLERVGTSASRWPGARLPGVTAREGLG